MSLMNIILFIALVLVACDAGFWLMRGGNTPERVFDLAMRGALALLAAFLLLGAGHV
jgi:hypothetical protein